MKSELSFLTDLFLNDEVPSPIKKVIAGRIKEVEKELTQPTVPRGAIVTSGYAQTADTRTTGVITITNQAPSMQKIMAQNPDLIPTPPKPVTTAAALALQERQKLINGAGSEKPEDGRRAPRKM